MFSYSKMAALLSLAIAFANVNAETHTVIFDNRCPFGSNVVVQGGAIKYSGNNEYGAYTVNGPISNFIAFLSSGSCTASANVNATGCTVVTGTLANTGSSIEIAASSPFGNSFPATFAYTDGTGATVCNTGTSCSNCGTTGPFLSCAGNDVNLAVRFC